MNIEMYLPPAEADCINVEISYKGGNPKPEFYDKLLKESWFNRKEISAEYYLSMDYFDLYIYIKAFDYRVEKLSNTEKTHLMNSLNTIEQVLLLLPLLKSDNVVVRTKAAAYCLALEINILEAERILQEIRDNPENRIFGFNAGMVLEVWKEDGKLSIYQKRITTDCIWRWKMAVKKGSIVKSRFFAAGQNRKGEMF